MKSWVLFIFVGIGVLGCHKDYCDGNTLHYFAPYDDADGEIVEKTRECANFCVEANHAADCVTLNTPCPDGYTKACFDNNLYDCTSDTHYPKFWQDCDAQYDLYCVSSPATADHQTAVCSPDPENCDELGSGRCFSLEGHDFVHKCINNIWYEYNICREGTQCIESVVDEMVVSECEWATDSDT